MLPPLQTAQDPIQAKGVLNHQVKYLSQVPECSRRYKATAPTIELQQLLTCSRELTLCLAFFVSSTLWSFNLFSSKCHEVGPVNNSVWQMKKQTHWQPNGTVTELSLLRKNIHSSEQTRVHNQASVFLSFCCFHIPRTTSSPESMLQPWVSDPAAHPAFQVVSMHLERHAQCFTVLVQQWTSTRLPWPSQSYDTPQCHVHPTHSMS